MTFDQWWATLETMEQQRADKEFTREAFAAGAASQAMAIAAKDTEIAELKNALGYDWDRFKASQEALREHMQMVAQKDSEIAELVAALEPFSGIDLVESRVPAEFAMLVLRARAAIAKVKKP